MAVIQSLASGCQMLTRTRGGKGGEMDLAGIIQKQRTVAEPENFPSSIKKPRKAGFFYGF